MLYSLGSDFHKYVSLPIKSCSVYLYLLFRYIVANVGTYRAYQPFNGLSPLSQVSLWVIMHT